MRSEEAAERNPHAATVRPPSALGVPRGSDMVTANTDNPPITAWVDGGCRGNGSGRMIAKAYGSYLIEGKTHEQFRCRRASTNNEAEYASLIRLLEDPLLEEGAVIAMDSQLVIGQLQRGWKLRSTNLVHWHDNARGLMKKKKATLVWVPREEIEQRLGH